MRPARTLRPDFRTMIFPSSSRETSRGSRLKNSRGSRGAFKTSVPGATLQLFFLFGDPVIHVALQNIKRQRAGTEYDIMKSLEVELWTKLFMSAGAQFLDSQLADLVRQCLPRPR